MADNQIVISDQSPQTLGVTPKTGEKLWCVVTDNGTTYKISKICIANSDVWSDPVDFAGAVGGGLTVADGDKGDITVSNSGGTWTIDNKAVTFVKLADMATGKLLGRSTATAGSPEVIDIDSSLSLAAGMLSTNAKIKAVGSLSAVGLIQSTGPSTAAILPMGAMAAPLLAAGDAAAVRGAIGAAASLGGLNALSLFENTIVHTSRSSHYDRFAGANLIYDITYSGATITNPNNLWDPSEESYCEIPANSVATILLDFANVAYYGFYYSVGEFHYVPFSTNNPASVRFELLTGATWNDCGTITNFGTFTSRLSSLNLTQTTQCRITVTSGAGICRIAKLRWIPSRSSGLDGGLFQDINPVILAVGEQLPQQCYSSLKFRDKSNTNTLLIGPGVLQFGVGATQTMSLRGTKTIGTPSTADTITVTGAAAGDIVSVSRGVNPFVSAPNTVQFDSTGLAGVVVSAIVERFI